MYPEIVQFDIQNKLVASLAENNQDFKTECDRVFSVLHKYNFPFLSGPQIGLNKQIIVYQKEFDLEKQPDKNNVVFMVNPVISKIFSKKTYAHYEGMINFNAKPTKKTRYSEIEITYYDQNFDLQKIRVNDIEIACSIQQAIDLFNGKYIYD